MNSHGYKSCKHDGNTKVKVGPYFVRLAKMQDISKEALDLVDVLIPLNGSTPWSKPKFGKKLTVYSAELQDHGGVPNNWAEFIDNVVNDLADGKDILAWCMGSHGRTGTFAASLIAKLEPETEDPIAAIRERHCQEAVETLAQAQGIFAIKGVAVPENYKTEFNKVYTYNSGYVHTTHFNYASQNANYMNQPRDRGERPLLTFADAGGTKYVFEETLRGQYLVWTDGDLGKPYAKLDEVLAKYKFLKIAGINPTPLELEKFIEDVTYCGFERSNETIRKLDVEITFSAGNSKFIKSSCGNYYTWAYAPDRYCSGYIEFVGDEPDREAFALYMKDSTCRGFKRVEKLSRPTAAVAATSTLPTVKPATGFCIGCTEAARLLGYSSQAQASTAQPPVKCWNCRKAEEEEKSVNDAKIALPSPVEGKYHSTSVIDGEKYYVFTINKDQEFVEKIIVGNTDTFQYLTLEYQFILQKGELSAEHEYIHCDGPLNEEQYDQFFKDYSKCGFKIPYKFRFQKERSDTTLTSSVQ